MACKGSLPKRRRSACVGDLRDRIEVADRAIQEPGFDSPDFGEKFQNRRVRWARINTVSGRTIFDGVGVERVITHEIVLRYEAGITSETWVVLEGCRRLDVLKVEDLEERREWLLLLCSETGVGEAAKA